VNSEPDEDKLDRIKSEIRSDADAARERVTLPERTSGRNPSNDSHGREQHASIAALAQHAGPAFVDHAYRTILHRPPDTEGFARQMAMLGAGASKVEVLGDLRYSAEGRRHAAPIPGLLPRYALAKVGRVPVLGAVVQWFIALAALPHLLRHQRATEASLAVRFGETATALQAAEQRDAELREAIDGTRSDLADAVAALSARLTQSETFTQRTHADVVELRQLALTMNHWTVQVRKSIDAIETAEAELRARNDETSAAIILRAREHDAHRAARLQAWATELAQRIPRDATVLDLAGGSDWLAQLSARGWRASSIENNTALHREARARNLDVTLGSPRGLLARISDASLDALTIASPDRIVDEMPAAELVREAHRILKSGGCLMIGAAPAEFSASTLVAVGFAEPKSSDAAGSKTLFAVRT